MPLVIVVGAIGNGNTILVDGGGYVLSLVLDRFPPRIIRADLHGVRLRVGPNAKQAADGHGHQEHRSSFHTMLLLWLFSSIL